MQGLLYWLSRPIVLLYARLMLNMDIFWHAPLPSGPQLIVANHPSFTDPFFVSLVSSQPVKILIIVTAFLVPLFGRYLRWSGHVPVDPTRGKKPLRKRNVCLRRDVLFSSFQKETPVRVRGAFENHALVWPGWRCSLVHLSFLLAYTCRESDCAPSIGRLTASLRSAIGICVALTI